MKIEKFISDIIIEKDTNKINTTIPITETSLLKIYELRKTNIGNTIILFVLLDSTSFSYQKELNQHFLKLRERLISKTGNPKTKLKINAICQIKKDFDIQEVYCFRSKGLKIKYSYLNSSEKYFKFIVSDKKSLVISERYKFLVSEYEKQKNLDELRREISHFLNVIFVVMDNEEVKWNNC